MEKKYFPIFVDISEKNIVVIGGGNIATRRVNTLLSFARHIVVVAPELTDDLMAHCESGKILWLKERYQSAHVQNADMVFAATNQPEINHQVKADCGKLLQLTGRQILVSVADDKELCDFFFPSIVQNEEFVIGINSGGKAPGEVKKMRGEIEKILGCESLYK